MDMSRMIKMGYLADLCWQMLQVSRVRYTSRGYSDSNLIVDLGPSRQDRTEWRRGWAVVGCITRYLVLEAS